MSDKTSYEMALDHYCEYCAFRLGVCLKYDCKCPAYSMNMMAAKMAENCTDKMVSPIKTFYQSH